MDGWILSKTSCPQNSLEMIVNGVLLAFREAGPYWSVVVHNSEKWQNIVLVQNCREDVTLAAIELFQCPTFQSSLEYPVNIRTLRRSFLLK